MWAVIIAFVGPVIAQILTVLGVSIVTYGGVSVLMDQARSLVISSWSGFPADLAGIIGLVGADHAVSIVLASIAARLSLDSVRSAISVVKRT